jgi:hypothetical protein
MNKRAEGQRGRGAEEINPLFFLCSLFSSSFRVYIELEVHSNV